MAWTRAHVPGREATPPSVAALLLVLLLAPAVTAATPQDPEPPAAPAFAEVVDVELVNVEAWVTDRKGRSISGLTVDDFEILEDGIPVEISHFAAVGTPASRALEIIAPELPPDSSSRSVASVVDDPGHLILFFDESRFTVGSRKRVIKALRSFLETQRVAPERILVLRHFETVSTEALFGSSAEEIRAAVDRLAEPLPQATLQSLEKHRLISLLKIDWQTAQLGPGDPCQGFVQSSVAQIQGFTARRSGWVSSVFESLDQTVTNLAGTPGVKTLLYISDGLELRPGADLRAFVDTNCPPNRYHQPVYVPPVELYDFIDRLTRHANSNRVTVYSLHASGLQGDSAYSAENSSLSSMTSLRAWDKENRQVERDGLVTLADRTGGRASFNTNGFGRIFDEIAGYMSSYYSLAYAPPHPGDGGEHEIEVRVRRPKTRIRHRMSYIDKSADERVTERLESALYFGTMSNPLAARLTADEPMPDGAARFTVPMHLLVPVENVVFLPHTARSLAQFRVQIAIHDTQAGTLDLRGKIFRPDEPPEGHQTLDLAFDLDFEPGTYEVAVALRQVASGETSYIKTPVLIHSPR